MFECLNLQTGQLTLRGHRSLIFLKTMLITYYDAHWISA